MRLIVLHVVFLSCLIAMPFAHSQVLDTIKIQTIEKLPAQLSTKNTSLLTNEQSKVAKQLMGELRCPICQGQSLLESDATLAVDLKLIIIQQIMQGKKPAQIKNYLVERYGDFILLKPPFKVSTILLWLLPLVCLLVGIVWVWKIIQTHRSLMH